ncbi:MAG: hypothetical protein IH825_02280 [Candidatus Marinimicrobia bacterium]|nr:hypothetical protein [Candidatus Neomarinimicrobiota bacterium]
MNRIRIFLFLVLFIFPGNQIAANPANNQYRNARFKELQSVDTLKELFNKDGGKVRLFLLMSPT